MARRPFLAGMALLPGLAAAGWVPVQEFDFTRLQALDPAVWSLESGFVRNRESQYYTPVNVSLRDGALVFEARLENRPNAAWVAGSGDWRRAQRNTRYTSGSIVLRTPIHFGRIEVVARSPKGRGVWPAVWLLNEGAGEYGEIDLFESVGKHPGTVFGAVHYGRTAGTREHQGAHRLMPGFEGTWKLHALEWTPERIDITVDGEPVLRFDPRDALGTGIDPLRRPMLLHMNLALGGSWGGPIDDEALPARFEVRSLRVLRWDEGHATPGALPPPPAASAPAMQATPAAPEAPPAPLLRWGR